MEKKSNEIIEAKAELESMFEEFKSISSELKLVLIKNPDPKISEVEKMIVSKIFGLFARAKNQQKTEAEVSKINEVSKICELFKEMKKLIVLATENSAKSDSGSPKKFQTKNFSNQTPTENSPKDVGFSFKTSTPMKNQAGTEGNVSFSFKSKANEEKIKSKIK